MANTDTTSPAGLKSKFLSASGEQVTVEQFALEHYATEDGGGWQGTECGHNGSRHSAQSCLDTQSHPAQLHMLVTLSVLPGASVMLCCHFPQCSAAMDEAILTSTGMHSEGGVWATLWGLLMWPVLFAEVPEVFRTPFQSAPLDLGTDAFFAAREPAIRARLQEIRCRCG